MTLMFKPEELADAEARETQVPRSLPRPSLEREMREACPVARLRSRLRACGLRPTRQRMQLGWMLLMRGDRHVTAETLYMEAQQAGTSLSLATVYNTLNQFRDAGLIRQIATVADRMVYDTNVGDHHHFLVEADGTILDVPDGTFALSGMPEAPPGYRILGIDVVVRLAPAEPAGTQGS